MKAPILTFFNNKGGVGKTSLIYHLAWMFALLDKRVVVADLDPQANLTAAFLDEDAIAALWDKPGPGSTIYQCVQPVTEMGDLAPPALQEVAPGLRLLPGDIALSSFEDVLSTEWPNSMGDQNLYRPMRILTAFWQVMQMAAQEVQAEVILVDVGPNLGAINRSVLLATDYVAMPLGADLFSLQGLSNLGPSLREWRSLWGKRLGNWQDGKDNSRYPGFALPQGKMQPIGYLCQQYGVRLDRPVRAYDKWVQRIPARYRQFVLDEAPVPGMKQEGDPHCLATVKHYRSLVPLAQEHRKPVFQLTPADGATGSQAHAVQAAKNDFKRLAKKVAAKMTLQL